MIKTTNLKTFLIILGSLIIIGVAAASGYLIIKNQTSSQRNATLTNREEENKSPYPEAVEKENKAFLENEEPITEIFSQHNLQITYPPGWQKVKDTSGITHPKNLIWLSKASKDPLEEQSYASFKLGFVDNGEQVSLLDLVEQQFPVLIEDMNSDKTSINNKNGLRFYSQKEENWQETIFFESDEKNTMIIQASAYGPRYLEFKKNIEKIKEDLKSLK